MLKEPTIFKVDDVEIRIGMLDVIDQALPLDKRVNELIAPFISELISAKNGEANFTDEQLEKMSDLDDDALELLVGDKMSSGKSMEVVVIDAIQKGLETLTKSEIKEMVRDLLSCVSIMTPDKGLIMMDNKTIINAVFGGNLKSLYTACIKVMEVNKFTFFELMGGGNPTEKINTFLKETGIQ